MGEDFSYGLLSSSSFDNNTRTVIIVFVDILEDMLTELDEVFVITISSGLFSTSTQVVILDNDCKPVAYSALILTRYM